MKQIGSVYSQIENESRINQHFGSEVLDFMRENDISDDYLSKPLSLMDALIKKKAPTELIDIAITITAKTTMT